jgi:2-methylisocitrate lyase-like PEP mutase family enzyme
MDRPAALRQLHESGFFVIPNPWDVGSAVRLERLGFRALATTSSGLAWSHGKEDQQVTFDELCAHVESLVARVGVPVSVDAERLYAATADDVTAHARTLGDIGAGGFSIEDYDPATGRVDAVEVATERVAAAVEGARSHGLVVTARAEQHLYGNADLDDTIARLRAYHAAGAEVVYAPGAHDREAIERIVAIGAWVNVLLLPAAPKPAELASVGVTRASTGGRLARVAYQAMEAEARTLLE